MIEHQRENLDKAASCSARLHSRFMKKLEHSWKALVYDGVSSILRLFAPPPNAQRALTCPLPVPQDSVSVHRPGFYASRFLKFMSTRVFRKNQCKSEPIRSLMLSGAGNPALINRVCREPSNLQPHHADALCVYYGMERCSGLGGG